MIKSLFLDVNIILSTAYKDGLSRVLFQFGKAEKVKLILSGLIWCLTLNRQTKFLNNVENVRNNSWICISE